MGLQAVDTPLDIHTVSGFAQLIFTFCFNEQNLLQEVQACEPMRFSLEADCKELVEGGTLDKADLDGVAKTTNAIGQRWNDLDQHVHDRQKK